MWNRTKNRPHIQPLLQESSLTMVDTIAEAVESAEIIFTCLGDVPDVEEVLLSESGVINFAPPNSLVVDFSTIGSTAVKNIASQLEKTNSFLRCPYFWWGYRSSTRHFNNYGRGKRKRL